MPPRLILASTSVYRRTLLSRLMTNFESIAPGVDERDAVADLRDPELVATRLAALKAEAVFDRFPDATVIGSDQVATVDGEILGKPHTLENAVEQLMKLSGRTHRLLTAVHICGPTNSGHVPVSFLNEVQLTMRSLTRMELARYVERDQPLDCAGSYKIEEAGIGLFESIQCSDFTSIIGLPLMDVSTELRRRGFSIP